MYGLSPLKQLELKEIKLGGHFEKEERLSPFAAFVSQTHLNGVKGHFFFFRRKIKVHGIMEQKTDVISTGIMF